MSSASFFPGPSLSHWYLPSDQAYLVIACPAMSSASFFPGPSLSHWYLPVTTPSYVSGLGASSAFSSPFGSSAATSSTGLVSSSGILKTGGLLHGDYREGWV